MRQFVLILSLMCLIFGSHAKAETPPDYQAFAQWPVLQDGRIKTLGSVANSLFYSISGDTSLNDISAMEWMTLALFDPATAIVMPVIAVNRLDILNLDTAQDYHTMADLMLALDKHKDLILSLENREPSTFTPEQRELMHVYRSVSLYNQVVQSFSAVLPLQGQDEIFINGGGGQVQRALIAEGGMGNSLLKIIPNDNPHLPKISLWQAINSQSDSPYIMRIAEMAAAWNDGDYATWNDLARTNADALVTSTGQKTILTFEHYYISFQPMLYVIALYLTGGIVGFFYMKTGLFIIAGGFAAHCLTLIVRTIILERPPTGTLYETLLFGAVIIMTTAISVSLIKRQRQNGLFLCLCALTSAFLLFVSRGFIQGDSLNVLAAVLNTNFWLSTHVTTIIVGYGFCVMAAVVAHALLINDRLPIKSLALPLSLAALLFTSVGTLLGGIWADQSWGRFWGWDPKENGALLIILWLAWIMHGRISGHFQNRAFYAMLALTNITVAVTWFGVNLLGIGLHSYGFISGIAWGLCLFIVAQLAVVAVLYYLPRVRKQSQNA